MEQYSIRLEDKSKIIAHGKQWAEDNGMKFSEYEIPEGFGIEKSNDDGYCSWMEFYFDIETDKEILEILGE